MKKIVSILFAFTLTIGTFLSFNTSSAQAKSLEENIKTFCGKDFRYFFTNGNDNPKAKVGETFTINFVCNGTATSYNAYMNVYNPAIPSFDGLTYGSKKLTKKKSYKVKVKHHGDAQVVFTFKDAKGKKLQFVSKPMRVYSTKAPKITGIEGGLNIMNMKKQSSFTIKNKQNLYIGPISNMDEMNYSLSAQLLNDQKKVMDKKYVSRTGYFYHRVKTPSPGTYYVKMIQKNIYTGKTASKTCKLIVK